MARVRNISTGPRGAYLDGVLVWAESGGVIEADDFPSEWFASIGDDPANDTTRENDGGLTLTEVGGGWWQIDGGNLHEPVKVRGEDAAREKFAELNGD